VQVKVAGIVTGLAIALLFVYLGINQITPAIYHPAPALAAETADFQPSIQSVPVEDTAVSVGSKVSALPGNSPNDIYFSEQWALQKMPGWQAKPGGPEVLVAVLDTGIDEQHEDLVGKVVGEVNFTDTQTDSDRLGHGTHVAGIIAATANNRVGIAGIAPNCRLLNVKVADDKGMVWSSAAAKGIIWATDRGARIINMSLAIPTTTPVLEEAVNYALSKGVVFIAAAGTTGPSVPTYPASCSNVIAVAATDINGSLWEKSNHGDWVNAYAPGVEIFSALPGNSYGYNSGTSMATAYVTAVAALMLDTVSDTDGDGLINDEVTAALKADFAFSE
jgi:thermitase